MWDPVAGVCDRVCVIRVRARTLAAGDAASANASTRECARKTMGTAVCSALAASPNSTTDIFTPSFV